LRSEATQSCAVTSSANVGHELVNRSSSGDVKRFVLSCQRWSFACTRVASNRNDGRLEARLLWVCYVCVQEKRGCLGAYALHPNIGYCMSVCSRALRVISALTIERIRSGRERERESTHRASLTSRWSIPGFGMNPPAVIVALLTSRLQYESGMNSEEIDRQEQSEPFSVPFESVTGVDEHA
jgi:hypothetical protein